MTSSYTKENSSEEFRPAITSNPVNPGPFLAKVISNVDPTYMGSLQVQILREVGNDPAVAGQTRTVKYLNPYYGITDVDFVTQSPEDFNNTQKSHGMWFVPPEPGTHVLVIFINGDASKGYWLGCVQHENSNFMIPGIAATKFKVSGQAERVPVAEYNKVARISTQDPTKIPKPEHPFATVLSEQGLLRDDIRGITSSSARRETPSHVVGISTPGPLDKRSSAKRGKIGKAEHKISNFPVSRLGGSTFVMDDGDDKFLRKTDSSKGPPEYASVENKETTGDVTRPHNELIRIRTRTGHQILLHNSEDLIYIGNARGTAWIELTSDGKIDIFSEDSISVRTKQDLNFYADRDINLQAGRNLNTKVAGEMHTHVNKDSVLIVDENQKIHIKKNVDETVVGNVKEKIQGNFDLNITGYNYQTSGEANHTRAKTIVETATRIDMNGPAAATAATAELPKQLKTHVLPQDTGIRVSTIMRRLPTSEPYPQHENLDPVKYKPEKTDRDSAGRYEGESTDLQEPAAYWKKYSTVIDTFEKIKSQE
jgi:hypothetical protein